MQADTSSTSLAICGATPYSYAGQQADSTAHGITARLGSTDAPDVVAGHVGGWIGVGGTEAGPGGTAEWLQTGLAAFPGDTTMQMYYEVTVPGSQPRYVELRSAVAPGQSHRFAVLEMLHHPGWWRVWVDGHPASRAIHLPDSDGSWYPQAMGESWNGGVGACNSYAFRFEGVAVATADGGGWRPLRSGGEWQDPGTQVRTLASVGHSFLATSA